MKKITRSTCIATDGLKKNFAAVLMLIMIAISGDALAATYYSKLTGNANVLATWGLNPDGTGAAPASFSGADTFIIRSGATLTLSGNWAMGSATTLQFDGNLNSNTNNNDIALNGTVIFTSPNTTQVALTGGGNGNDLTFGSSAVIRTANVNGLRGTNASLPTFASGLITLPSTATYEFNAAANQVTLGLPSSVANLIVNTPQLTLSASTAVTTLLTMTSGNVVLGSNNLTVNNISNAAPSVTRMIIASGTGELRKTFTSNGSFTFPVGDNTSGNEYSPVTVSVTGTSYSSAYVGVRVIDAKHPNNASASNYLTRYWNLTQSGITGSSVTATATYDAADIVGTESSIASARLSGTFNQNTNPWVKFGTLAGTVQVTGVSLSSATSITGINAVAPTVEINGGDLTVCTGTSVPLSTTVSGDGTFIYAWTPTTFLSSSTSANPTVNSPTATTTYTVTAKDGNGIAATDSTTITVAQLPNAGPNQTSAATCGLTTVSLNATTPNVGTGSWSIISGENGSFSNENITNPTFTGDAGSTYVVRWTVSGTPCATNFDDVTITFNQNPTTAVNTSGQTICNGSTASLAANTPSIGTGTWSVTSGPSLSAAQFNNVNDPSAIFSPAGGTGSYVVRWTVSNSPCTASTASATIVVAANVTYYADADGDGFGNLAAPMVSCTGAPAGHVLNSTDCDDTDNTKNTTYSFFVDADNDGFGSVTSQLVCAVNAATPPAGYALNNTDCNDSDANVNAMFPFFTDADNDGFGTGGSVMVCAVDASTPPAGYALNNTDCDDSNAAINATFNFYVDADNDAYGTGSLVSVCAVDANTPPSGYALNAGDCNDNAASVNPGMTEVLYNGIDDNCNGSLDEGNQLTSQVVASQCGTTLATISSAISAVSFDDMTAWRFEVTNTSTNAVQTIIRPYRWFSLTMLPQYDYATTYSVRVEMQRNNIWLGYYGPACLVSSPAVLAPGGAAQVSASQCNSTLATINTLIATTSINGVTGYRFRVTNLTDPSAPNQVQILDRSLHWFSMTMLPTYTYGTTYMIEVAVKTTGAYSGFGSPCVINTPAVPTLTSCNTTIATSGTIVATLSKNNVTSYRFEVTNLTTNLVTTIDRPVHWFRFNMIPNYVPNDQYGVRVALMTTGVYSMFSDVCEIVAPGAARFADADEVVVKRTFDAVGYPNPFADTFTISGTESATVKVYDMTGRLLESIRQDGSEVILGQNYPSGVYNVIVSEGENSETLRMIKR